MSASAAPISITRFAAALPDLSLSSLYAKAAEIRNSIGKLRASNDELESFAIDGDTDCYEAMIENREVIKRMEERVEALKMEVVSRGNVWHEEASNAEKEEEATGNGEAQTNGAMTGEQQTGAGTNGIHTNVQSDTNMEGAEEEGVHL